MADTTIPMLPQAIGLTGAEQIEVVQAGASARASLSQVATFVGQSGTPVLVSALPNAGAAGTGSRRFVSDSTAVTFGTIVIGGGGNAVPVYSDGAVWRIG
jgi:hypothetical protein